MGIRIGMWVGITLGLVTGGCGDPDPLGAYCSVQSYCFAGVDYAQCIDDVRATEALAIAKGQVCLDAFSAFHECVGELSCADLDAYYADGAHCGTRHAAYEASCPGLVVQ
jgi:hypothetical protein